MADDIHSSETESVSEFLRELEISFIVHELKDPFAVIEAGLRGMLDRRDAYGPLTERQEKTLRRLLRSTMRGRSMVEDLMEIGRAEAGHFRKETIQPATTLRQTLLDALETVDSDALEGMEGCTSDAEAYSRLAERGIRVEIDADVQPEEVSLDENKFRQIVGNLIKNALRFRKERLHIRLFKSGQELIVEVADDGPGIAKEHHDLIFQPYAQVSGGAVAGRKGHGLGLAGAQTLARRLGGRITLSSEAGEGSVFRLAVPIKRTQDS